MAVSYRQDGPRGFDVALGFGGDPNDYKESTHAAFALTGPFTVTLWVSVTALGGGAVLLSKAGTNQGYALAVRQADGLFDFSVGEGAGIEQALSVTAVALNTWYFLCGTYSTSATRLYVGTEELAPRLEGVDAGGTAATSTNALRLGAGHHPGDGVAYPLNGRIAQPAVLNLALTEEQVRRVWQRGPQAYNDAFARYAPAGGVALDPTAGATNRLLVRADHTTTAPLLRTALTWRPQWS